MIGNIESIFANRPLMIAGLLVALLLSPAIAGATPHIYHVTGENLKQHAVEAKVNRNSSESTVLAHLPPVGGMKYPPRPFPRNEEKSASSFRTLGLRHGRNPDYSSSVSRPCAEQPVETRDIQWSHWLVQESDGGGAQMLAMDKLDALNVDRLK